MKAAGLVLLVLGLLGLAYGGFSYTRDKSNTKIGPINIQVTEKERVNVPLWAGIGAVAVGATMLLGKSSLGR